MGGTISAPPEYRVVSITPREGRVTIPKEFAARIGWLQPPKIESQLLQAETDRFLLVQGSRLEDLVGKPDEVEPPSLEERLHPVSHAVDARALRHLRIWPVTITLNAQSGSYRFGVPRHVTGWLELEENGNRAGVLFIAPDALELWSYARLKAVLNQDLLPD